MLRQAVDAGAVAGVLAAAATDAGVVYAGAQGARSLGQDQAMTTDTVFLIASMTKTVTTVAALQQVERRRLHLDEPLVDVVPELAAVPVLEGFGGDGTPRLRPPARPITLRRLLTHTAGFAYDRWNATIRRYATERGIPDVSEGRLETLWRTPLVSDPGERWEYSSLDWVGIAVERVCGERLSACIRREITEPLGMTSTGFELTAEMRSRIAGRHRRLAGGDLETLPERPAGAREFDRGGGGLYSTAGDYLTFLRMLMNGGTIDGVRILRAETVAEMERNQIGDLAVTRMVSARPDLTRDVEMFPGIPKKWGLGHMITMEAVPSRRSAGSLTWAGLNNTYYWLDRARRLAAVVCTQVLPFADPQVLKLVAAFETALYGSLAG